MAVKDPQFAKHSALLFDFWKSQGSPPLRTICEVAVGPESILGPFRWQSSKAIFIEPHPFYAHRARRNYPWATILEVAIAARSGKATLRQLAGGSFIDDAPWAPALTWSRKRQSEAIPVIVDAVMFDSIDDGEIDLLNLDCEGSEWFVLQSMKSRPGIIFAEICEQAVDRERILEWFSVNGYRLATKDGNASYLFTVLPKATN